MTTDTGKPFCLAFNVAVMAMAERVCPTGYDVAHDREAPATLEALNAYITEHKRILVSAKASERTIFGVGNAEYNYAFRAWHDWTHWAYQLPFTTKGEQQVAAAQCRDIQRTIGFDPRFRALIREEVVGQAEHYHKLASFPDDQRQFARAYLMGAGTLDAIDVGVFPLDGGMR